ncbi:sterol carrier family protein [Corynebacterium sp. CCM 8835]|uniref:Bacterial SCP orthologue domain-containing protein n=1 Tax=Corynebacterium antarcticum TaxID=2800405 RepID=A0ABS1FJ55_9CORY|nr:sterol carrier family protein [Corynebacterium antarcticum]MCK7643429.1 sterol carrier family protein [Corynebacterium antarcticum]MCL0246410.1 sterol carrier family protein [Corynebacterium antarcticum]MCX7541274.1 sterol carrier family protein [Corynebacterium antarcticum]
MTRIPDPAAVHAAVTAVADWIRAEDPDAGVPRPSRGALADAVRLTARALAADAPGKSVEVRVPPFVAVQCVEGLRHTRGTPPNVVECDPHSWLRLACGLVTLDELRGSRGIEVSGTRAHEITRWLPVLHLPRPGE